MVEFVGSRVVAKNYLIESFFPMCIIAVNKVARLYCLHVRLD